MLWYKAFFEIHLMKEQVRVRHNFAPFSFRFTAKAPCHLAIQKLFSNNFIVGTVRAEMS